MNKNVVWGLAGVVMLLIGWHYLPAVTFWVNEMPLSGPLAGVASGGMSLLSMILAFFMVLLMLFFFAGIGLFIFFAFCAMVFPWLLPLLIPVLLVMMVVWLYRQLTGKGQSRTDNTP